MIKKLFFIIFFISIIFVGCNKDDNLDYLENLYNLKTNYIGDVSKIGNIFENLQYQNVEKKDMKIISDKRPFGLVKNFYINDINDINENDFIKNSVIFLFLVDNADFITSYIVDSNGNDLTYNLSKESIIEQIGDFKDNLNSYDGFKDLISKINEIKIEKS